MTDPTVLGGTVTAVSAVIAGQPPTFELALAARIEALSAEVGRLRRLAEPDSSLAHLADRMASQVQALDLMLRPSAADIYRDFLAVAGSQADDLAIEEALAVVDGRARLLRGLLAEPERERQLEQLRLERLERERLARQQQVAA